MKLTSPQLTPHLKKTIASLYWISSDEFLLAEEAIETILSAAMLAGFTESHSITPETNSHVELRDLLYTHTQSMSLFSDKKIIILHLHHHLLTALQGKILLDYAIHPAPGIVLIIQTKKLDRNIMGANWYIAIEKISVILVIMPILAEQLPAWLIQRAKQLHMQLTLAGAAELARLTENNTLAAGQAIEKLRLLYGEKTIDEPAVTACISDAAYFDIFHLVDSALSGNSRRCTRILQHLMAEGIESVLILWAITREIRLLANLKRQSHQEKGISISALCEKYRIWGKRQAYFKNHLKNHTQIQYWQLLTQAAWVDRVIKGVEPGNIGDALEMLILQLADAQVFLPP